MPVMYGAVGAPSSTSAADGFNAPLLQGKAGEGVVAELHGKWYTSCYRGRLFMAPTLAAGITIPSTTATAATYLLYNPIGSGVNMELTSINVGFGAATLVVGTISLGLQYGLQVAPTSLTALTATPLSGTGKALGTANSAGTLAAAVPTTGLYGLFGISATSGVLAPLQHEFDGKVVLPPGSLGSLCCTIAAQASASNVTAVWAEYPI